MNKFFYSTSSSRDLEGHTAVITGASSGIGKEYAFQLAAQGVSLLIAARRLEKLVALQKEILDLYKVRVRCFQVDLAHPDGVRKLFKAALEDFKEITILINSAGLGNYGNFLTFPFEKHHNTLQVNIFALTELTYLFAKHMSQHGRRSYITQVASIAAFQPVGFFTTYSGTKGYVRYFSETLAFELRKTNVKVMCLCPGGTYTEFFHHSGQKITRSGHTTMMTPHAVVKPAIQAMLKGKTVYVPGILNKIACFLPRILPRQLGLYLAHKTMTQAVIQAEAAIENGQVS